MAAIAITTAALLVALSGRHGVNAQDILIKDRPSCPRCRLTLDSVATLVGRDSVALSHSSRVVATKDGFFVGPTYSPGQIAFFDPSGTFVRIVGRPGMGPGEIRAGTLMLTLGPGDSLHVVNENRWLVFSPPAYEFARMTVLQGAPTSIAIVDSGENRGDLLGAYPWQAASGRVFTVHLLSARTGAHIRSFDAPPTDELRDISGSLRAISWHDGRVWSIGRNRINVRSEQLNGDNVTSWSRQSGWFPPWSETNDLEPFFARPRPNAWAVRVTDDLIWLYATVADDAWKPLPLDGGVAGLEGISMSRLRSIDPATILDGVVEVIDRGTGLALSRSRLDWVIRPLAGSSSLAQRTRETGSGEIVVDVYRFHFVRE